MYALAKERYIQIGVILQPYIDLEGEWSTSLTGEDPVETCRLQVHAAVEA